MSLKVLKKVLYSRDCENYCQRHVNDGLTVGDRDSTDYLHDSDELKGDDRKKEGGKEGDTKK